MLDALVERRGVDLAVGVVARDGRTPRATVPR
jgi:hypothetical protein